jgi:hypothetical protein
VEEETKDLLLETIPAGSRLDAALHLIALAKESSSVVSAPFAATPWRVLLCDGVTDEARREAATLGGGVDGAVKGAIFLFNCGGET